MSELIEKVAKAIQAKCVERGYRECPAPLVHHVAAAAIEATGCSLEDIERLASGEFSLCDGYCHEHRGGD